MMDVLTPPSVVNTLTPPGSDRGDGVQLITTHQCKARATHVTRLPPQLSLVGFRDQVNLLLRIVADLYFRETEQVAPMQHR